VSTALECKYWRQATKDFNHRVLSFDSVISTKRNLVSKQFFNFKFNQEIDEETLSLKPLLPDNAKT